MYLYFHNYIYVCIISHYNSYFKQVPLESCWWSFVVVVVVVVAVAFVVVVVVVGGGGAAAAAAAGIFPAEFLFLFAAYVSNLEVYELI